MRTKHPFGCPDGRRCGKWIAPLLIVCLYLTVAVLADPRGEFPLNDDWAYARSAFGLAAGRGLHVDEWAAPSLVGQTMYGGLVTRLFGQHFLVLRLSTLVLSCGIALLLWSSLRAFGTPWCLAWLFVLTWVFNPIQFNLSFTFMTEIPFLFFIMVGISLFLRTRSTGTSLALAGSAAFFGYAYLIRQTALLFVLAGIVVLLVCPSAGTLRSRIKRAAVWGSAAGIFVAAYHGWIVTAGGWTPAGLRKLELLRQIGPKQILGNLFGLLFYVAFMLTPLWIFLISPLGSHFSRGRRRTFFAALALWLAVACSGLWWFRVHYARPAYLPSAAFHEQMPFLLNILYDTGLGPVTLDPTYYGTFPTPSYPHVWLAVTLATAVGLAVLGTGCTLTLLRWRDTRPGPRLTLLFLLLSFAGVTVFEVIFSHQQEGGLFDRHILTAALPALILVAGLHESDVCSRIRVQAGVTDAGASVSSTRPFFCSVAFFTVLLLAWFSVAATHDYLSWNRLRWKLGSELLNEGVNPLHFSGGFEFNAWHNYDTFRARGNIGKVYYWWYDDLRHLITMEPQERYRVRRKLEYFSWVHRRFLPVFLLERTRTGIDY